jgi:hypothetical protein
VFGQLADAVDGLDDALGYAVETSFGAPRKSNPVETLGSDSVDPERRSIAREQISAGNCRERSFRAGQGAW